MRLPSIKTIESLLGETLAHEYGEQGVRKQAIEIRFEMHKATNGASCVRMALDMINAILQTHGVESIYSANGECAAVYCNTGDSYAATVLYDCDKRRFVIVGWADWIERQERSGRKFQ